MRCDSCGLIIEPPTTGADHKCPGKNALWQLAAHVRHPDSAREACRALGTSELSAAKQHALTLIMKIDVELAAKSKVQGIVNALREAGGGHDYVKVDKMTVGDLLRDCETNSITITAKYVGPRKCKNQKHVDCIHICCWRSEHLDVSECPCCSGTCGH